MNLVMHGILDARIELGDTLRAPKLLTESGDRLRRFDRVILDPPFSLRDWGAEQADKDPFRRIPKVPPKDMADFAFVLHCLATLEEGGRAVILVPQGVLFRTGSEQQIRRMLVQDDRVEALIGLAGNLLFHTRIAPVILVLRNGKPEERQGKVLFM